MPSTSPVLFPCLNQMLGDRSFSLLGHRRSCLTRLKPSGQAHCRADYRRSVSPVSDLPSPGSSASDEAQRTRLHNTAGP